MAEFKLFSQPDYAAGRPGDAAWYKDRAVSDHINEEGTMHRARLLEAADLIETVGTKGTSIADWGAGNGGLLHELGERGHTQRWGYDLSPLAVAYARDIYGEEVSVRDVVNNPADPGDLVILTEFLEHIVSPHKLLGFMSKMQRNKWLVASSPCNEDSSSFYDFHLWAWTGTSFADMFTRAGWTVRRHYARVDANTQFILAERP